ncbi:hypothetical protein [Allosphingosinicella deserti]|uniref:Uncharacterized protein n=1 Tax=Allosphingosinicella deserti TaxID=2116704 RepID=A0A2P7QW90_9SPHN|nr:hypothetical protein [Sphingomonas deserti]PSJ42220.1 hypothetical protein C7I55_08285 [Sphingomonas deserti]
MLEQAIFDVADLNERLSRGKIFLDAYEGMNDSSVLFKCLEEIGFHSGDFIIISLTPDGDDTMVGRLMTRDKDVYEFDLNLNEGFFQNSHIEKVKSVKDISMTGKSNKFEDLEELAAIRILEGLD